MAEGHYTRAPGTVNTDAQCGTISVCQPGQYTLLDATPATNRVCVSCADGSYSTGLNQQQCVDCSSTYTKATPPCTPGQYYPCLRDATPKCLGCAAGTFSSTGAARECTRWAALCQPGTQEIRAPSYINDRACMQCPSGSFRTGDMPVCEPHAVCPPGTHERIEPSHRTDRACEPCPWGSFRAADMPDCRAHTTCPQAHDSTPTEVVLPQPQHVLPGSNGSSIHTQLDRVIGSPPTSSTDRVCVTARRPTTMPLTMREMAPTTINTRSPNPEFVESKPSDSAGKDSIIIALIFFVLLLLFSIGLYLFTQSSRRSSSQVRSAASCLWHSLV